MLGYRDFWLVVVGSRFNVQRSTTRNSTTRNFLFNLRLSTFDFRLQLSTFDFQLSTFDDHHSTWIYWYVSDHFDPHTRILALYRVASSLGPLFRSSSIVHDSQRACTPFFENSWVTLWLFMFNMVIGQSLFFFVSLPTSCQRTLQAVPPFTVLN